MTTRERILEAAFSLIAKRGYDKTTIALICEEVKVKKPSVYYYFKSKEEIFLTLIKQLNDYSEPLVFTKENFKEELIQYGFNVIDYTQKNPTHCAFEMEIYAQVNRLESVRDIIKNYGMYTMRVLKRVLERGVDLDVFSLEFDVELNASLLALVLDGLNAAIIYQQSMDYHAIWKKSVEQMFFK